MIYCIVGIFRGVYISEISREQSPFLKIEILKNGGWGVHFFVSGGVWLPTPARDSQGEDGIAQVFQEGFTAS